MPPRYAAYMPNWEGSRMGVQPNQQPNLQTGTSRAAQSQDEEPEKLVFHNL